MAMRKKVLLFIALIGGALLAACSVAENRSIPESATYLGCTHCTQDEDRQQYGDNAEFTYLFSLENRGDVAKLECGSHSIKEFKVTANGVTVTCEYGSLYNSDSG